MQNLIEKKLKSQKNKVVSLSLSNKNIEYHEKIKSNIKVISGDEEVSRAFLIDRLVNELDYSVELTTL